MDTRSGVGRRWKRLNGGGVKKWRERRYGYGRRTGICEPVFLHHVKAVLSQVKVAAKCFIIREVEGVLQGVDQPLLEVSHNTWRLEGDPTKS